MHESFHSILTVHVKTIVFELHVYYIPITFLFCSNHLNPLQTPHSVPGRKIRDHLVFSLPPRTTRPEPSKKTICVVNSTLHRADYNDRWACRTEAGIHDARPMASTCQESPVSLESRVTLIRPSPSELEREVNCAADYGVDLCAWPGCRNCWQRAPEGILRPNDRRRHH